MPSSETQGQIVGGGKGWTFPFERYFVTLVFFNLLNEVLYCIGIQEGFQKFRFESTWNTALQVMPMERFLEKRDF